jgi:hypothetical protein
MIFLNFFNIFAFNINVNAYPNLEYRDISGDEIDLALEQERPLVQMPIVESLHQETVEASQAEVHESEIQVPIAKKRGRKPKLVAPIDIGKTTIG